MQLSRPVTAMATMAMVLVWAAPGRADTKSWAAARQMVPDSAQFLIGADVSALQKTAVYPQFVAAVVAADGDFKEIYGMAKQQCSIDLATAAKDVAIVVGKHEEGLVVVTLNGVDEKAMVACMQKFVDAKHHGGTITGRRRGRISEYGLRGEREKLYASWLAKDVVAFATDPTDRALLDRLLKAKPAKGAFAAMIDTAGAATAGMAVAPEPGSSGDDVKGGYGTFNMTAGKATIDAHIQMATPTSAQDVANDVGKDLAKNKTSLPPEVAKVIAGLKVNVVGAEVVFHLEATDKDLAPAVAATIKSF